MVQNLNRGLRGSPMAGTGRALEASGFKWKISPYFMAGAAATESTLGAAACSNDHFNVTGMNSCQGWDWSGCRESGLQKLHKFPSWAGMYDYYARYLSHCFPGARTPWDFHGYALCDACWGNSTAGHMRSLFGVGPEVRYGAISAVA